MLLPRLPALFGAIIAGVLAQVRSEGDGDIKGIPLRTHSLDVPYLDSDMQTRWWEFGGNTIIRTDQYIRLTADRASQEGWLFSRVPLTATNWEIEVEFKISGKGNLYGDGFAMWLTRQRATPGPVFGSTDHFEGLGIFFDTYKNERPGTTFPYVMVMNGNGYTSYDKPHDGKDNDIGGCSARGIRNAHVPTKAKLTYFQDQNLVLQLQYKNEHDWQTCFDVPNIKIPSVAYLGFSAETGELSDNHDIIKVSTKNLYDSTAAKKAQESRAQRRKSSKNKDGSGGGWGWFFIKIVLFLLVVAGGYVGFTMYRANQRSSRF